MILIIISEKFRGSRQKAKRELIDVIDVGLSINIKRMEKKLQKKF